MVSSISVLPASEAKAALSSRSRQELDENPRRLNPGTSLWTRWSFVANSESPRAMKEIRTKIEGANASEQGRLPGSSSGE